MSVQIVHTASMLTLSPCGFQVKLHDSSYNTHTHTIICKWSCCNVISQILQKGLWKECGYYKQCRQ